MAIEIVSFPIKKGGSFHSYVNVYQRVDDLLMNNSGQYLDPNHHIFHIDYFDHHIKGIDDLRIIIFCIEH